MMLKRIIMLNTLIPGPKIPIQTVRTRVRAANLRMKVRLPLSMHWTLSLNCPVFADMGGGLEKGFDEEWSQWK